MNRSIALGTFVLLTAVSVAYGGDGHDGIQGNYKEKGVGKTNAFTLRKAEGREAGPWRMTGAGGVNWALDEGVEGKPGGAKVYFLVLKDGPYKGGRFDIVRDSKGNVASLQETSGPKKTWVPENQK